MLTSMNNGKIKFGSFELTVVAHLISLAFQPIGSAMLDNASDAHGTA